jgi:hypothetical protein
MQIVPPRYLGTTPGRPAIIDALAPGVRSWFADTITEPIPEELAARFSGEWITYARRARSANMEAA